jgi:hypothetical protein
LHFYINAKTFCFFIPGGPSALSNAERQLLDKLEPKPAIQNSKEISANAASQQAKQERFAHKAG